MKGLHVFPEVIDSDFQGEIRVMVCTHKTILTLTPEQKIAQLILIPYRLGSTKVLSEQSRGTKGFGSPDRAYWIQQIGQNRPELELKINRKNFKCLIDTGGDVSVISLTHWPAAWPMQPAVTQRYGIGQSLLTKALH
jgi:hypothetical protein